MISRNESNVVTPIIDVIDKQTFEYKYSTNSRVSVGGFDWNMVSVCVCTCELKNEGLNERKLLAIYSE
jgi:hypothetical protein